MRILNLTAGRLSRHRRGPLAGVLLLLLGLLTAGGLWTAVMAPAQAEKTQYLASQVEEGRKLFLVGCSTCHGTNGEGITTDRGNNLGPSLVGVGAAAVDFQVGTGRMPMAQPGAQAPRKEVAYTEEETAALAAYLIGPGCTELGQILAYAQGEGPDPLTERRRELRAHLLGPDGLDSAKRFDAAVSALAAKSLTRTDDDRPAA